MESYIFHELELRQNLEFKEVTYLYTEIPCDRWNDTEICILLLWVKSVIQLLYILYTLFLI